MRRALVICLLTACGAGPDDLFVVSGRTVATSGAGLDAVPISITRSFEGECTNGKLLHQVSSADGGLFSFDLVRIELQPLEPRSSGTCVRAQADFKSGTAAWADLFFVPSQLPLSDFNDWSPRFSVDADGGVRFTPVVPDGAEAVKCRGNFPSDETLIHAIVARADGGVFWEQSDHTERLEPVDGGDVPGAVRQVFMKVPLVLPADVLEDARLELSLEAKRLGCVEVSGGSGPGLAEPYQTITRWSNVERVVVQGHRTPASRGARCTEQFFSPCPLTDGDARSIELPSPMNDFRLQLGRPARIRSIVFRGALLTTGPVEPAEITVRAGTDSITLPLPDGQDPLDQIVFLPDGQTGQRDWRYIVLPRALEPSTDLELELNRTFLRLGELSLFEE